MAKAAKEKTGESRTESGNPDISQQEKNQRKRGFSESFSEISHQDILEDTHKVSKQGVLKDTQEISQDETRGESDREWRCISCSTTAPPTASGYMSISSG